jgi:hypothetical protein
VEAAAFEVNWAEFEAEPGRSRVEAARRVAEPVPGELKSAGCDVDPASCAVGASRIEVDAAEH